MQRRWHPLLASMTPGTHVGQKGREFEVNLIYKVRWRTARLGTKKPKQRKNKVLSQKTKQKLTHTFLNYYFRRFTCFIHPHTCKLMKRRNRSAVVRLKSTALWKQNYFKMVGWFVTFPLFLTWKQFWGLPSTCIRRERQRTRVTEQPLPHETRSQERVMCENACRDSS